MAEVFRHAAFGQSRSHRDELGIHGLLRAAFGADQSARCPCEVLGVARNVEPHNIAAEQTFENLFPPGKNGENVVAGKRCVVEEGDLQIGPLFADVAGSQPEVVVMHPDRGAFGGFGAGSVGKTSVDCFEDLPVGVIDIEVGRECVQNRPETFLGCDVIEA